MPRNFRAQAPFKSDLIRQNRPPLTNSAYPTSPSIRRQDGEDFRRTLLALERVVRRNNLFREAVALVFAAEKSEEVQVAFAIDGKLSDAYERAFAEHGGPRKMGFVRAMTESDTKKRLERLVGRTMYRSMPDPASLNDARTEEAEALLEVDSTRPVASRISGRARASNPAVLALAAAEERLATARHTLDSFDARPLACYEQTELLDIALKEARRSPTRRTSRRPTRRHLRRPLPGHRDFPRSVRH